MSSKSVKDYLISAFLLLLPFIYFLPANVLLAPGDGWTQNLGVRYFIGHSLRQGMLPFWNPYIFAGMPLLATVYPGALYPPNWLFALLSPTWAMNLIVITTFHLALIGTYLFARSIKLSRLGAVVAAISFSLGGFMIAHIGHTSRIAAAAWLPWVLLAIERLHQENKWRWVCLGAVFIFLQFVAGEPQMLFFTALVCGSYVLFSLLFRPQNLSRLRFILSASLMALCGVLFSFLLLLPARELQAQGERANMAYEHFSAFSLPPQQTLAFIFPYFFGGAAQPPYLQAPGGTSFWGEWTVNVSAGYIGLAGLMLCVMALFAARKHPLVWLWLFIALGSLTLAFGGYLPFGINQYLHQIPGYNVFRGSYRHLLEYTFAMAMLAGTGLSQFAATDRKKKWRMLAVSVAAIGLLVLCAAVVYFNFAERLVTGTPRLQAFGRFSNAEAWVPLALFFVGAFTLFIYAKWQNALAAALVVVVVLLDLASFGWFYEWRNPEINEMSRRIPDAPTVKFIKSQEPDLNAFRIVSDGAAPFKENYEYLNYPNNSIMRGLQSVNGYDVLKLNRVARLAGDLDEEGKVIDTNAFSAEHQGFNLLNVKYLLREKPHATNLASTTDFQGIKFSALPLSLKNSPGSQFAISVAQFPATEIAIISSLANSILLKDGTPILKLRLHTTDGSIIARELVAGRDTSEWAYDREDVKARIQHQRAPVIESWEVSGYQGHRYLARLSFNRAEIERIEIDYAATSAECFVIRASLFDGTTQTSYPLFDVDLPSKRWRKVYGDGPVEIYENQKALPRAWLVRELLVKSQSEALAAIKTGKFANGESFIPEQSALLEVEDFGGQAFQLPQIGEIKNADVQLTHYAPNQIQLETNNPAPSFLVVSEVHYRGWNARVDGAKVPVWRVNHILRGLALAPGPHKIEFYYTAPSFYEGVKIAVLGAIILILGAFASSFWGFKASRNRTVQVGT
jgi:hypothetical protein